MTKKMVFITVYVLCFFCLAEARPLGDDFFKDLSRFEKGQPAAAQALVFFAFLAGCPQVKKYLPRLREIRARNKDGAEFFVLDSNIYGPDESFSGKSQIDTSDFTVIKDEGAKLAKQLQIKIASQVVVVDRKSKELVYSGAIDDQFRIDISLPKPKKSYLLDILEKIRKGKEIAFSETAPSGCVLNLN